MGGEGESEAEIIAEVEFRCGLEDFAFACLTVVGSR